MSCYTCGEVVTMAKMKDHQKTHSDKNERSLENIFVSSDIKV